MRLAIDNQEAYAYTGGKAFDPSLPCLVFIHGALCDHCVWTLLARWFANHGYGVLAVDLPGHMRSAGPPIATVEAMADWVLALLDAAGVQNAALVGHSMGSLIALQAAANAPQRATHLVMVATAYPMKVSQALLDSSRDSPLKAIDMMTSYSYSTWAAKPSYPGPGMWTRGSGRALNRMVLRRNPALLHHDFSACNSYAGGLHAAARVICPATLVLGERDQMTSPKASGEIAAALKAKTVLLPSGHIPMAECPDAILSALRVALA
jgi:pimeloyl-ACP methyl ester carboxylesterase